MSALALEEPAEAEAAHCACRVVVVLLDLRPALVVPELVALYDRRHVVVQLDHRVVELQDRHVAVPVLVG